MKSEKVKNIGQTIFAFGLLFLGIETMGSVMKPLADSPVFTEMIARVSDVPILGVAVGTLMTLVVQNRRDRCADIISEQNRNCTGETDHTRHPIRACL